MFRGTDGQDDLGCDSGVGLAVTVSKICYIGSLRLRSLINASACAAALTVLFAAVPALPQAADPALNQAFEHMLQDPSDPERSFRYAAVAVERGAVNDAIAAL